MRPKSNLYVGDFLIEYYNGVEKGITDVYRIIDVNRYDYSAIDIQNICGTETSIHLIEDDLIIDIRWLEYVNILQYWKRHIIKKTNGEITSKGSWKNMMFVIDTYSDMMWEINSKTITTSQFAHYMDTTNEIAYAILMMMMAHGFCIRKGEE